MLDKIDPQTVSNAGPNVLAMLSLGLMIVWSVSSAYINKNKKINEKTKIKTK